MEREHRGDGAVLLDAMGTLLYLEDPAGRLAERLAIGPEEAGRALRAEIAYYRSQLHRARDPGSLASLRAECAEAMRPALPELAARLPQAALVAALLDALRFAAFPDAAPALQELRAQGRRLVVVSNWDVSLDERLAETGLLELVDATVASAPFGAAKPDRAIFERGLALAGGRAAAAWHVGDDLAADVAGARGAGLRAVFVDRAGRGGAPPGVPVLADLDGLPELLLRTAPYA
jgi:putative hydrolase of the HAD superfamily